MRTPTGVEDVCTSLDGLPLAIELAAARTVAVGSRRSPDASTTASPSCGTRPAGGPNGDGPWAAIAWSYDLLFPDDQRGLWALSCFAGERRWPRSRRPRRLGVPDASVVDVVCAWSPAPSSTSSRTTAAVRYRLLDSIRAFAADRLRECGLCRHRRRARTPPGTADRRGAATVRGPASPSAWPPREPNGPTSTPPSPGPRPTTRSSASASRVRLDVGRPRRRRRRRRTHPRRARRGRGPSAGPRVGSAPRRLAGGLGREPRPSPQADLDEALPIVEEELSRRPPASRRYNATGRSYAIQLGRSADVVVNLASTSAG